MVHRAVATAAAILFNSIQTRHRGLGFRLRFNGMIASVPIRVIRGRQANFPRKGSKNFTQYSRERPEMTTQ